MQIPIIPHRGQKKPWGSIPRINWNHPLTWRLQAYAYDAGGYIVDLVGGGKQKTITGSGVTNSPFGNGHVYSATVGIFNVTPIAALGAAQAAPFTISLGFYMTAAPAGNDPAFGLGDASGNNSMFISPTGSTTCSYVFSNGGTADISNATVPACLNKYSTATGVAASTTSNVGYFNGLVVGSNTNSNATTFSGSVLCFNTFSSGVANSTNFVGNMFTGVIWNRALSQIEVLQLHQNPYCFLIYPEDELFAELVGASFNPAFMAAFDVQELRRPVFRRPVIIGGSPT